MNYIEFLTRKERLKALIDLEHTGTAEEVAEKLCFSRRTLFNYLEILRCEGYEIKYCKYRRTYFFEEKPEKV
ncbi:hypothetical protein [Roseimarinus sediminis]|uniref:hypothetical protein n=1 Tax=Roseimarinus sediminis TaxID=1610899 RepID=UPI003D1A2FE6